MEDVDDDATTAPSASGWIVIRNLRDFEKLHRSLKEARTKKLEYIVENE